MQEAYVQGIVDLKQQCESKYNVKNFVGHYAKPLSMAIIQVQEDDENTSVMKFFYKTFKKYVNELSLIDIKDLRMKYHETDKGECVNNWAHGDVPYECLFNIYPKEWMIAEVPNYPMKKYDFKNLNSIEPFWKLLLGNKAILPLLWSMYPNHPNLLAAYYDDPKTELGPEKYKKLGINDKGWVSKPIFGREGMGIFFSSNFTNYDKFV